MSPPDDEGEGGGGVYSAMGSKFSAMAMKAGKKAAQSEAGRSATKAAVKGAADGARQDLTSRYGGSPVSSPTAKTPTETVPEVQPESPHSKAPSHPSPTPSRPSHAPSRTSHAPSLPGPDPAWDAAPRASQSKSKSSSSSRQRPAPKPSGRRVYKHVLTKKADWDELPLVQALFDFRAKMKCDLEFRKGQVIQVLTRTERQHDWWEGKIEDRVGIFPANYVKLM